MKRVAVLLVTLFLVNLPLAHQALTDREITRSGRVVEGELIRARTLNGRLFVDYRLPRSVDPGRIAYSARVDASTFERAKESGVLAVRVVPGEPGSNRAEGEVGNRLFAVVALTADVILLAVVVLFWRRWRRFAVHEVVGFLDGNVVLSSRGQTLTVVAPEPWTARLAIGDHVSGQMHLVADGDVLPGRPLSGLEQLHGASYVVRGRVVEARTGRVQLELDDGFRLAVETGGHRIRADIRDSTEVSGTLCFTPTVSRD